ncbi:hypothetical protein BT96DRAFT_943380 [Gymnopus androsaceus JB14]|uniref:Uncharacterized protein n=1 Tax=Gymnopus androsaceus JB14 TaxID=1447944 RepID=A0A6A4H7I5_9AGAR|nr:hypothetical protein BT96DRAFT_943380 [Gymnopus androsaceus JB14]
MDNNLQEIFSNPDAMKALWQKYDEEKVAAIQVSKHALAKSISEKMNLLQEEYFHLGVQDVMNLYESFVATVQKVGTRKLYQSKMASEIVQMITQGLCALTDAGLGSLEEITGIVNLTMSYVSFAKNIVVPYKTKRLYEGSNGGEDDDEDDAEFSDWPS